MLNPLQWWQQADIAAGGLIIIAILLMSCVMWVLILDRYLLLWRGSERLEAEGLATWRLRHGRDPAVNHRLRDSLRRVYGQQLRQWLTSIQVITAILPLLGLLGTVTGMIKTFEVLTVFGSGNVRGMAEGISQALLTTMAGLLTAVSGMYFVSDLQQRAETREERFSESLSADSSVEDGIIEDSTDKHSNETSSEHQVGADHA